MRLRVDRLLPLIVIQLFPGCKTEPASDPGPTPSFTATTTLAPPPPPTPITPQPAAYVPPTPGPVLAGATIAEVEIAGPITMPKQAIGEVRLIVADGPCWKKGTQAIADQPTNRDRYFAEVFVRQGTQVWICLAVVPPKGALVYYGESPKNPLLGKGMGEVAFMDTPITVQRGKPVERPPAAPPPRDGLH